MARIGGRSLWLAVPVGMLCIAVVAALLWLAVPMVPVAVAWVGDSLRTSTGGADEASPAAHPAQELAAGATLDCRDVYPDLLWAQLIWHGDVLLSQSTQPAPIAAPELVDALAPSVLLTCSWRLAEGTSIVSTVAAVSPDAAAIAEPALAAQGFSCATADTALRCTRTQAGGTEEHVLRDGLWLMSVATGWTPDAYGERLAAYVWQ